MPRAQSTYSKLLASTRRGGPGTILRARTELFRALRAASATLDAAMTADDAEMVLRAAHCVAQIGSVYARVTSEHELEERLTLLEKRFSDDKSYTSNGTPRGHSR